MKILVAVKRVVDANVAIRVKSDESGVETANVKMAMNPFDGQTLSLAFPAITLGSMPAAGGAAAAKLDEATRARIAAEQAGSAFQVADRLAYDDVIDPRELRNALLQGLKLAEGRRTSAPQPALVRGVAP